MTTYMVSRPEGSASVNALIGIGIGVLFTVFLVGFDLIFRKFNLRSFNIAIIGIFVGYLMGTALVIIFDSVLDLSSISISLTPQTLEIVKIALLLFGIYLGTILTLRSSDELYVSLPFVKFTPTAQKKKDLIIDSSCLSDARVIDLCNTGILDQHVIIPRFIIKDLYSQVETGDDHAKSRAKRSLETIKKMEALDSLGVRFNDTDFPEVNDLTSKIVRLARLMDSNIITADITRVQMATIEGVKIINMHALSNALKPLMDTGEHINIKVQRYGKEPRQGVGYLDDGTMVVINGGGNFIGETIDAQVLSVKHTSSGRMIFCNAPESEHDEDDDHTNGNTYYEHEGDNEDDRY